MENTSKDYTNAAGDDRIREIRSSLNSLVEYPITPDAYKKEIVFLPSDQGFEAELPDILPNKDNEAGFFDQIAEKLGAYSDDEGVKSQLSMGLLANIESGIHAFPTKYKDVDIVINYKKPTDNKYVYGTNIGVRLVVKKSNS